MGPAPAAQLDLTAGVAAEAARRLLDARLRRQISVPAPGAGIEVIVTVPGGTFWEVMSFTTTLITSAVVANRRFALGPFDADGNILSRIEANGTQAASTSLRYNMLAGMGPFFGGSNIGIPLPTPPLILSPNWQLRSVTSGLDVGDAYQVSQLVVREISLAGIELVANDVRAMFS